MPSNLISMSIFCVSSITAGILTQLQNHRLVEQGGQIRNFYHPFMQTQMMIIGEALCFFIYLMQKQKLKSCEVQLTKQKPKFYISFLPVLLDLSSSYLIFVARNFMTASIYSIMGGFVIIASVIFTKLILKKKIMKYQIIGCLCTILGVTIAGFGQFLGDKTEDEQDLLIVGILILIVAFTIQAYQTILVQSIYRKYDITPLQLVGLQGIFGTLFWTIIIIILSYTACPLPSNHCVIDSNQNTHLENIGTFFYEFGNDAFIIITTLAYIVVVGRYNFDMGTVIIKTSAILYCILNIFSNYLTWILAITITLIGRQTQNSQLQIESLSFLVNGVKLIGLIIVTLGMLIYNQIILKNLNSDKESEFYAKVSIQSSNFLDTSK